MNDIWRGFETTTLGLEDMNERVTATIVTASLLKATTAFKQDRPTVQPMPHTRKKRPQTTQCQSSLSTDDSQSTVEVFGSHGQGALPMAGKASSKWKTRQKTRTYT